jgi:hypothetical protein
MAKKTNEDKVNELPETIENVIPKEGAVDLTKRVEVTTTDKAPYHKANQKIMVTPVVAEKMKKNNWAK